MNISLHLIPTFTQFLKGKLLLTFCSFFILLNTNAQSWIQIDDFPATERDDGTTFTIGNIAYCGTGYKVGWSATRDFYAFDMISDTWSTIEALPAGEERQYASGFSHGNHGFIFGGLNGSNYYNDVWMYDPTQNNWTEKTSLPSVGRRGCISFVIDGIAYIIGGRTSTDPAIAEVWAYDINNDAWHQKNDFPFGPRYRGSGAATHNRGYLIFGSDENDHFFKEFYEYNPTTDSWLELPFFPVNGRTHSSLNSLSNKLIVVCGIDGQSQYAFDIWRFNTDLSSWEELTELPAIGRKGGMSFNNGTNVYYTAGIDPSNTRLKETWKYVNALSIDEISKEEINLKVYPNPTYDILTLELTDFSLKQNSRFTLTNHLGKVVLSHENLQKETKIELKVLSKGLYFLNVWKGEDFKTMKVVKL
ncbi:Kelch repeat-containing protein [Brumimicrobium mesophilum]|uniref:Kelch repeat-containing protein n=1 Tax=Brumimicrobium mesophilum TaxID=392717 RepID=UPI00131B1F5E|nr:kelch repeat-containing protein [Brumimicrobium mesophilum]